MSSRRVYFENPSGDRLCGIIDRPDSEPVAFAIFSHCFTCNKDLKAIVRISRNLAKLGIAVLRFDFTGLGDSRGSFLDSNFDSNITDLKSAVDFLTAEYSAPRLFIGHSLGGGAMMASVSDYPTVEAIVTIASPSSTLHLAEYLSRTHPEIIEKGAGNVTIGGRTYTLKKQLIENLRSHDLESRIREIRVPHLVLHPPDDLTLPFWHAEKIFELTGGPKSMISLAGADHLLVNNPADVEFVADMIARWFERYSDSESV